MGFRDLLETDAAGVIMVDLGWCGGFRSKKIAGMAEAWHLWITPHDLPGRWFWPRRFTFAQCNNAVMQEGVRAY